MRKAGRIPFFVLLAALLAACLTSASALTAWQCPLEDPEASVICEYDTDTLYYRIRQFQLNGVKCFLTEVCMADPGKQIGKQTAAWRKDIALPSEMAKKDPSAALVINGSGYVSPVYPWIPPEYPGVSRDYHYTPLGSLTVTGGEVFRDLEGVPYYGLTLEEDGLHMYVAADNGDVLARHPAQTWSFYVQCPLIRDREDILDRTWPFAQQKAMRTIIGKVSENDLFILTVSRFGGGLTVCECVDWIQETIGPEWAYNLDGGPSSALLYRKHGSRVMKTAWGNGAKDADIMTFSELEEP